MLATGKPKHLAEWVAYYEVEPFGEPWRRHSLMTSRTLNTMMQMVPRDKKSEPLDFYEDKCFVPGFKDEKREQAKSAACAAADSIEGLGV